MLANINDPPSLPQLHVWVCLECVTGSVMQGRKMPQCNSLPIWISCMNSCFTDSRSNYNEGQDLSDHVSSWYSQFLSQGPPMEENMPIKPKHIDLSALRRSAKPCLGLINMLLTEASINNPVTVFKTIQD